MDNLKPVLINYVLINGVSTGLLIGSVVRWHRQNLEGGLGSLVSTLVSTGTALLCTAFYLILIETEGPFSTLKGAAGVAGAVALIEAVVGVLVEALIGALAGTFTVAGAVAGAGAGAVAGALAELIKAEAIAVTGAAAGHLIITKTRLLFRRLSNVEQPHSISSSLAQAALVSVPFLVTSWLVSVNQWVMNNVSVHETMQGVYYPGAVDAFFSGEWIEKLYHLLWLTE